ncbi:MAG TPA: circularly permuted type 2 ATP-grasp protein [Acidimicrobiales bacterium]
MGDLFDYGAELTAWDEMLEAPGCPRPAYEALYDAIQALSAEDLADRGRRRDRSFRDQGITFSLSGQERPFPLDLIPRVIDAAQWRLIERGVIQRVRALEAFLADVYGGARILKDGVVPRRLVNSSTNFQREAAGIEPANGVRVHVAGIDLIRGERGRLYVLEDNVRTPSGISYVIENRRAMTQVLPELFTSPLIRPVAGYPARLFEALRAAAPAGVANPTVAVLTPGRFNSAYFEHSFLARQMGVELVEGRDLVCRDRSVFMRTTDGERRVDVIYRRIDDDYLDPLHFRPNSVVGCPGLVNAARSGRVTLANAVGNGVADDKAIYPYVPEMIQYYLGEAPLLENVPTLCLERDEHLAQALDRLDELVFKPVDGSGGHGLVMGPQASTAELDALRTAVLADPRRWIAQEVITLSTAPTWVGEGLRPRHVDLRPFAVNDGTDIWVVPGGLTRVALPEGSLVVNSSQGGGSKDTWVVGTDPSDFADVDPPPLTSVERGAPPPQAPVNPPGSAGAEQQQQQQQQQQRPAIVAC